MCIEFLPSVRWQKQFFFRNCEIFTSSYLATSGLFCYRPTWCSSSDLLALVLSWVIINYLHTRHQELAFATAYTIQGADARFHNIVTFKSSSSEWLLLWCKKCLTQFFDPSLGQTGRIYRVLGSFKVTDPVSINSSEFELLWKVLASVQPSCGRSHL